MKYVSDIITEEEYSKWDGKIVLLSAGTGKGKTSFIMDYVKKLENKKALYLCNRLALKEQIEGKQNIPPQLDTESYQSLETKLKKGESLPEYDIFIMDECHYFLDDSAFNPYTDLVYWYLLRQQKHKTRIFMSATGVEVFSFIKKCVGEEEIHHIPDELKVQMAADYDYLNNIYWLHSDNDIVNVLNMVKSKKDERVIFFADSMKKINSIITNDALKINKRDIWFYYSNNSKQSGCVYGFETNRLKEVENYKKGKRRFLFSTIALDNGVDIKDIRVKHIICNIFDFNEVIQCFGRKRVENDDDKCDFYVMIPGKHELELKHNDYIKKIKEIDLFNKDPNKWEIEDNKRKNGRTTKSKLIYQDPNNLDENGRPVRTVNKLAEYKIKTINRGTEFMLGIADQSTRNTKYEDILIRRSGITPSKAHDISELIVLVDKEGLKQHEKLEEFLGKYCGQRLTVAKKRKLTQLCCVKTKNKDGVGRPQKINDFLEEKGFMYQLDNSSTRIDATKTEASWIIKKNLDAVV